MPRLNRSLRETSSVVAVTPSRRGSARIANDKDTGLESPARSLQQLLADDLSARAAVDGRRWAPRSTLLLAGSVSLAIWGAVAFAIAAIR
jgi:hypothetical protein